MNAVNLHPSPLTPAQCKIRNKCYTYNTHNGEEVHFESANGRWT